MVAIVTFIWMLFFCYDFKATILWICYHQITWIQIQVNFFQAMSYSSCILVGHIHVFLVHCRTFWCKWCVLTNYFNILNAARFCSWLPTVHSRVIIFYVLFVPCSETLILKGYRNFLYLSSVTLELIVYGKQTVK